MSRPERPRCSRSPTCFDLADLGGGVLVGAQDLQLRAQLRSLGLGGGLQRMEGYENILANYPDIVQVVSPADCAWDTAQAQATVESWLAEKDAQRRRFAIFQTRPKY